MCLKNFLSVFLAGLLCSLSLFPAAAVAGDDPPVVDENKFTPVMRLSSPSTVEVNQGTTQDIMIEVKNVGTSRADNFLAQAIPKPEDPFKVSVVSVSGSDMIGAGVTKQLRLIVTVDKGAAAKVYPIELIYSYINEYGKTFSEKDTLNIKVNNSFSSSRINLYNFRLEPKTLTAGETAILSFDFMNVGSATEKNVKISLEDLKTETITVPGGLNSITFESVPTRVVDSASFTIKASPTCKNGVYPIKLVTSFGDQKNAEGQPVTETLQYYVTVGGASEAGNAALELVNPVVPSGVFSVGESFDISFELRNTSGADANNLLVKAVAPEDRAVVPTSQSMFMTRELKAGESQAFSFTFAATSAAKSQNYPVSFSIEYDAATSNSEGVSDKISFSQFFGVTVSNPQKDEEDKKEDEKLRNVPKIIVSSYSSDPKIVKAGTEFDLSMTFMNAHAEKQVKNIKVSLTATETSADAKTSASIFSPVNASNTLYIDQIAPKQTESRTIRYYAIPNANAQTYSINVNFDYEDAEGNEIKAQEIVGINVAQPPSIETTEISIPEYGEAGMPIPLSFQIYNTGKVTVYNLKTVLEGEMTADGGKTIWVGNFEHGSDEYIDASFYYEEPGEQTGRIIVSYDSATGEHFEIPTSFSIMINEPMPMEPDFPMEPMQEPGLLGSLDTNKKLMLGALVLAVAGALGFGGYRLYKKKKSQKDDEFFE